MTDTGYEMLDCGLFPKDKNSFHFVVIAITRIPHPASRIPHLASRIPYLVSRIPNQPAGMTIVMITGY
jgi:hypothetical protein